MNNRACLLLILEQRSLSLEDHSRLFMEIANLTHYPDYCLCTFYKTSLNDKCRSWLSRDGPQGNFTIFVEWALTGVVSPSSTMAPRSVCSTVGRHHGCGLGPAWLLLLQVPPVSVLAPTVSSLASPSVITTLDSVSRPPPGHPATSRIFSNTLFPSHIHSFVTPLLVRWYGLPFCGLLKIVYCYPLRLRVFLLHHTMTLYKFYIVKYTDQNYERNNLVFCPHFAWAELKDLRLFLCTQKPDYLKYCS